MLHWVEDGAYFHNRGELRALEFEVERGWVEEEEEEAGEGFDLNDELPGAAFARAGGACVCVDAEPCVRVAFVGLAFLVACVLLGLTCLIGPVVVDCVEDEEGGMDERAGLLWKDDGGGGGA